MNLEFPYQLVAFLDRTPTIGESVYYGDNGWYPQIALKRRFELVGIEETTLLAKLQQFCDDIPRFSIQIGDVDVTSAMPVRSLGVTPTAELMKFHNDFITTMANTIKSRYPERDGVQYVPHITTEYDNQPVVDESRYRHTECNVNSVFLLKDVANQNSVAYARFDLKQPE